MIYCPKCDQKMEHQEEESDVNVQGGYYCDTCEIFIPDYDVDEEP